MFLTVEATMLTMATRKVSVTLDEDAIERARHIAGPRGLSSYVDAALQEKLERDDRRRALLEYFDELDAIDPPTDEQKERADRWAAEVMAKIRR
jgi:hypothetical protein